MLAHRVARLAPRTFLTANTPCLRQRPRQSQRTFFTSTIQTLSDGFLDLAIALPYPPSWPAYSSTIILVTVVSRLLFTVPISVWSLRRRWRTEELVMPHIQELQPKLAKAVIHEMHTSKVRGTKEEIKVIHAKRTKELLTIRQNELFKKYRCRPLPTMLIPPLSQLPMFMGTTYMLNRASQAPTPLDSESFLTITSLTHADPTATLPIILGLITFANVETSRWFMSQAQLDRERKVEEWTEGKRAEGRVVLQPRKIVQSGLRFLSVGRIIVGTMVPGSIIVYWVTSATFGLIQTWIFDYLTARRKKRRSALAAPSSSPRQP